MIYFLLPKIFSLFAKDEIVYSELAEEASLPPPSLLDMDNYSHAFLKMFLSLLFFLALAGFSLWFLRKVLQKRKIPSSSHKIQILGKRALSPKSILYLVEIENKRVLVSESQLDMRVTSLGEPEKMEPLLSPSEEDLLQEPLETSLPV